MISNLNSFYKLILILTVFASTFLSCKKDNNETAIETTIGANTLFVEVDGVRYQPKKILFNTSTGSVSHNGVEFRIIDKSLREIRQNFTLADMFHFTSDSFLSSPVLSRIRFRLSSGLPNGVTDISKLLPFTKGDYDMGNYTDEGKHSAEITYYVYNDGYNGWNVGTYETKKGSGKLSITKLTNEIISGKIEATVESGYGSSYDSKKIILYFDYAMNTINNKLFE